MRWMTDLLAIVVAGMQESRVIGVLGIAFAFGPSFEVNGADLSPLVFNTGVDDSGAVLPDYAVDPHYALIQAPAGSGLGPSSFVADSARYPFNGYWTNSPESKWIAPQALQNGFDVGGDYIYRTTIDLSAFDLATVQITGTWTTDNIGQDILLNGQSTRNTNPDWTSTTPFSLTTGFVKGINTLDFQVNNLSGSTGLRIEMAATGVVPEPSALVLLTIAAASLFAYAWRRRRQAA
jgi:hypothetical protein